MHRLVIEYLTFFLPAIQISKLPDGSRNCVAQTVSNLKRIDKSSALKKFVLDFISAAPF